MFYIKLSKEPLEPEKIRNIVTSPQDGATISFSGSVRDTSNGKRVIRLEVEAYEQMAKDELERICAEASDLFRIRRIAVAHRLGGMEPGDIIVVIAVAAPHRSEAYNASRFLIEELKSRAPIWKKEIYEDGENWMTGGVPPDGKKE